MAEPLATTSSAADSPTPSAPLTQRQPEPSRADNRNQNPFEARLGAISDAAYDTLPTADRDRYARVRKGPEGGSEWVARNTLPSEQPDARAAATGSQPNAQPVVADGVLVVGDYRLSPEDIATLLQTKAANDLKATQVPADPSAYEAKLPEGLRLPPGVDFKPDPADPAFRDFQALSKKLGLTQSDFEQIYGIFVSKTVQSEAAFRSSMKAELDKLGTNRDRHLVARYGWRRPCRGDAAGNVLRKDRPRPRKAHGPDGQPQRDPLQPGSSGARRSKPRAIEQSVRRSLLRHVCSGALPRRPPRPITKEHPQCPRNFRIVP